MAFEVIKNLHRISPQNRKRLRRGHSKYVVGICDLGRVTSQRTQQISLHRQDRSLLLRWNGEVWIAVEVVESPQQPGTYKAQIFVLYIIFPDETP